VHHACPTVTKQHWGSFPICFRPSVTSVRRHRLNESCHRSRYHVCQKSLVRAETKVESMRGAIHALERIKERKTDIGSWCAASASASDCKPSTNRRRRCCCCCCEHRPAEMQNIYPHPTRTSSSPAKITIADICPPRS